MVLKNKQDYDRIRNLTVIGDTNTGKIAYSTKHPHIIIKIMKLPFFHPFTVGVYFASDLEHDGDFMKFVYSIFSKYSASKWSGILDVVETPLSCSHCPVENSVKIIHTRTLFCKWIILLRFNIGSDNADICC